MTRIDFDFVVAADHPSLAGHFPGNPVVPGVLLLDEVMQALHRLAGSELTHLQQVKFTAALLPGEQAHGWCRIQGERASFGVNAQRGGVTVALAQGGGTLAARVPP